MVDVYSTEPERQAAIAEVTRLRRQFDTTTAKGAKAFAADPEAQAAMARLDKAKSAAGMRTRAQDLAALNKIATSDTATMKKDEQGRMTAAPTRAERAVTKELNAPSRQYFKQVKNALTNPEQRPTWQPGKVTLDPEQKDRLVADGDDISEATSDWILVKDDKSPSGKRWNRTIVGIKAPMPKNPFDPQVDSAYNYGLQVYLSGKTNVSEFNKFVKENNTSGRGLENATINNIRWSEIAENLPDITYQELERLFLFYGNEVDNIEELVSAYEILFGENK